MGWIPTQLCWDINHYKDPVIKNQDSMESKTVFFFVAHLDRGHRIPGVIRILQPKNLGKPFEHELSLSCCFTMMFVVRDRGP